MSCTYCARTHPSLATRWPMRAIDHSPAAYYDAMLAGAMRAIRIRPGLCDHSDGKPPHTLVGCRVSCISFPPCVVLPPAHCCCACASQVQVSSDVESIRESVRERFASRIQGTRRGAEEDDSGIAFGESFAEKFGDQIPDVPPAPSAPPLTEEQRRRNAEWARVSHSSLVPLQTLDMLPCGPGRVTSSFVSIHALVCWRFFNQALLTLDGCFSTKVGSLQQRAARCTDRPCDKPLTFSLAPTPRTSTAILLCWLLLHAGFANGPKAEPRARSLERFLQEKRVGRRPSQEEPNHHSC